MLEYIIIAFSFALSSLWFIHNRGLYMAGVTKYSIIYDISFILIATLTFPVLFIAWLRAPKGFIKAYGETLAVKIIKENK